ncbi:RHS repeat domain-containing protein [Schinkia azotoformans]
MHSAISSHQQGQLKLEMERQLREENPFRYASYFYDEETKLYYLSMRWYEPLIGRYLSRDIVPSTNLYLYSENNHINRYLRLVPVTFNLVSDKIKKSYQSELIAKNRKKFL